MMADKAPCLEPEDVLNDWTSSTDADRDRYFRSRRRRHEEALSRAAAKATIVAFKHADESESLPMKGLYQQEIVGLGILTAGGFNFCWSHSDGDIGRTLDAPRARLAILAAVVAVGDVETRLEGSPIEAKFRRT